MTTYDDLMPVCQNGCPYWEIACCIDNKLALCSMCELEMRKQEKENDRQKHSDELA